MLIRAGSTLMAPRGSRQEQDVTAQVADNAQLSLAPEVVVRRITVKAGKKDTVASIAARYKVKPADVARWNDVAAGARFKPGEQVALEVPVRQARGGKGTGTGTVSASASAKAKGTATAVGARPARAATQGEGPKGSGKSPVKVAARNAR